MGLFWQYLKPYRALIGFALFLAAAAQLLALIDPVIFGHIRPRLLIFDEATSALDSLTEEEITQTIRDVSASRDQMTILIAHRLSTILHAGTIYVLEKGKIAESGTHEALLSNKGLYYALWRQQIGERRFVPPVNDDQQATFDSYPGIL
jgi:ABC-type multidrug transport system ATPase subunit